MEKNLAAKREREANDEVKRQQFMDGVSVPVVSTPNIRFVGNFPETAAISGRSAPTADPRPSVQSSPTISIWGSGS